jgi:membrane-associated phospholipid phosphatase
VFYKLPANSMGFITYNYGLNLFTACVGSYALVQSNADWNWYRFSENNPIVSKTGMSSVIVGGLVPLVIPLGLYYYGRKHNDQKLQITGLALGQAAILGLAVSSSIKAFTGRRPPHDNLPTNFSNDFKFGFLNRGAFNGWPSGHTMTAIAMATTLVELYPENTAIKVGSFAYASIIGLGISVNIHWFSDAFAGALIGYAIGKTVGQSYSQLLSYNQQKESKFHFYTTLNGAGVIYKF